MSIISATVTRGITYVEDSLGRVLQTKDRLHQLGKPTVNVTLTNLIAAEDLKANSVTSAKLSAAVQALIGKVKISVGLEASDAILVTAQVQDANDADLSGYFLLDCWLSDTAVGSAPTGTPPETSFTPTTGTIQQTVTAKKHIKVITDSTGKAILNVNNTSGVTDSWYLNVNISGKVYIGAIITIAI